MRQPCKVKLCMAVVLEPLTFIVEPALNKNRYICNCVPIHIRLATNHAIF